MRFLPFIVLPTLLAASCQTHGGGSSDMLVTNGKVAAPGQFPQVVQIEVALGGFQTAYCTGTFVSSTTLITAAHCAGVTAENGVGSGAKITFAGKAAQSWITHPKSVADPIKVGPLDLAVVIFPMPASPTSMVAPVGKVALSSDAPVVIVGYGKTHVNQSDAVIENAVKHYGTTKVVKVGGGEIYLKGLIGPTPGAVAGTNVATAPGDSGGPLFDAGEKLVGVTSGGGVFETAGGPMKASYFVDLQSPLSRRVLCRAVAKGGIIPGFTLASCGTMATAESCTYGAGATSVACP